ncbi:MAG: tight adherence protein [Frankiales bacterium]|jgi:tight adherence protein B|nr:tight adherence protein [Frankiales bacterium]
MTAFGCAVVAAAAAGGFLPGADAARRVHRLRTAETSVAAMQRIRRTLNAPLLRVALVAGVIVGAIAMFLSAAAAVPAGVITAEVVRRALGARHRQRADHVRAAVPELCTAMAAELRAGQTPARALAAATETATQALVNLCAPVVSVAELGGDVPGALRSAAGAPGADALGQVAACWSVSGDVGAGLAAGLQRLGAGLRAAVHLRRQVDAQLAGARATGRLLALLPLLGLALGAAIGAAPGHFLLHTPAGAGCLWVAVLLDVAGLAWMDRIAARVVSMT